MVLGLVMVLQMLTRDTGPDEDEAEQAGSIPEIKEKNSINSFVILQEREDHLEIRLSFKLCIVLLANTSCILSRRIMFRAYCDLIKSRRYVSRP